jgi:hypothetical protein
LIVDVTPNVDVAFKVTTGIEVILNVIVGVHVVVACVPTARYMSVLV